ncbi:MAG: NAD kinase [Flavobacteriaceae bacterium]|nr:NAD kinase [Flavobacteriaceae bacterium]MDG1965785.1 NAD kinase [Flavobacteriaceae bacterium]
MNIAIFCAFDTPATIEFAKATIAYLENKGHHLTLDQRLSTHLPEKAKAYDAFDAHATIDTKNDYLFSIGGDGTLLRSITFVKDTEIPILGINTGRLGFLTSLQKESLNEALDKFFSEKYKLVKRALLAVELSSPSVEIEKFGYALNEISINRKNTTAMLSIATQIDKEYLTTYWADGLIISTPTGSTGYSLSSGGPILTPETEGIVLNPIAPHNLNIRPLVVPDKAEIEISVDGRGEDHLLSLDSRIFTLENGTLISIKKAPFSVFTVELDGDNYFKTLRDKLFWGYDARNRQ